MKKMERKEFLKRIGLGSLIIPVITAACGDDENDGPCAATASETAGPFPTKSPSTLVQENIISDRVGVALTINITVQDRSDNCNPLTGAIVDIWHCDKDGSYSEYGGTGMQSTDYTAVHFLRGRQTTSSEGKVSFVSIFPGWYSGRAPHIHVHIYDSDGNSRLVTQIAFPKTVTDVVYSTSSLYAARGEQDTTNESDNVFGDGVSTELASLTGSITDGYTLEHTINVAG
jgi:protocatechuate 3,4-dioxygenase beta subunit